MATLSWVKGKSEDSTQKYNEAIRAHNILYEKYNELKSSADHKVIENARLSKELMEVKAALSAREAELKRLNPMQNTMGRSLQALSSLPLSSSVWK